MRFVTLFIIITLSGCTLSSNSLILAPVPDIAAYQRLQHIRIERWGKVKFNGILALRATHTGLHYALIDATGIKLLQAWSDAEGNHNSIPPTGPLAEKGLAPFLSEAIARIYLINPFSLPCSRTGFRAVCIADEDGIRKKTGSFAGVRYWHVEGGLNVGIHNSGATGIDTRYSQPWLGVEIVLQDLSAKE